MLLFSRLFLLVRNELTHVFFVGSVRTGSRFIYGCDMEIMVAGRWYERFVLSAVRVKAE